MNKDRRKQIAELIEQLGPVADLFEELKSAAEDILSEEQEYFDNMPESLQMSDRGQQAEEAISNLEYVAGAFEDIDIIGIIGYLEEAQA